MTSFPTRTRKIAWALCMYDAVTGTRSVIATGSNKKTLGRDSDIGLYTTIRVLSISVARQMGYQV